MKPSSETPRKTLSKTTQRLKFQKSKAKSTHHIIWRSNQITEVGEKKDVITHREFVVHEYVIFLPPGKVSTYGGVAWALHSGPRCVGEALRVNLPLIRFRSLWNRSELRCPATALLLLRLISAVSKPCVQKKRMLLKKEGVNFTKKNKVLLNIYLPQRLPI
ncbi:hypothetical protein PsorP6_004930 [Peronosclerospora sorghi]|uniref:Uncharacterized protein n=1 Tax=Peronosclerospora sorghi TaxID=230839 RepID=A0ACC0W319_9STRA|nr:hypothetical protein PsorP6_004930 [Peronosclerospora sorghi]